MHCFKDFPLNELVSHSNSCTGDVMGARERFKNFIPSVHDVSENLYVDPMSLYQWLYV